MSKKSLVLTLTAVVLALAMGIGGTIAYFTNTTGPVTNVFTMGQNGVAIELKEHDGNNEVDGRTYANVYPGQTVEKDPFIRNTGDYDVYVGATVTFTNIPEGVDRPTFDVGENWTLVNGMYIYQGVLGQTEVATLFEHLTVPSSWTTAYNFNVVVNGYAVQADGLTAAEAQTMLTGMLAD